MAGFTTKARRLKIPGEDGFSLCQRQFGRALLPGAR